LPELLVVGDEAEAVEAAARAALQRLEHLPRVVAGEEADVAAAGPLLPQALPEVAPPASAAERMASLSGRRVRMRRRTSSGSVEMRSTGAASGPAAVSWRWPPFSSTRRFFAPPPPPSGSSAIAACRAFPFLTWRKPSLFVFSTPPVPLPHSFFEN
jgi:hypothetical protein